MLRLFNPNSGKPNEVPAEKVVLPFSDPDTREERLFIPYQAIVGDLSYENINNHPFVYDQKNGYVSLRGEGDIMMRKLQPAQIELIEAVLKIKAEADKKQESEIKYAPSH